MAKYFCTRWVLECWSDSRERNIQLYKLDPDRAGLRNKTTETLWGKHRAMVKSWGLRE